VGKARNDTPTGAKTFAFTLTGSKPTPLLEVGGRCRWRRRWSLFWLVRRGEGLASQRPPTPQRCGRAEGEHSWRPPKVCAGRPRKVSRRPVPQGSDLFFGPEEPFEEGSLIAAMDGQVPVECRPILGRCGPHSTFEVRGAPLYV